MNTWFEARLSRRALVVAFAAIAQLACGSSDSPKDEIASGSGECTPGLERCECLPNGGCDQGLECRSDLCVEATPVGLADGPEDDPNTSDGGGAESGQSSDQESDASSRSDDGDSDDGDSDDGDSDDGDSARGDDAPNSDDSDFSQTDDGTADDAEAADDVPSPIETPTQTGDDASTDDAEGPDVGPPPSGCGDTLLDPGEACDDGNQFDGDGCAANCLYVETHFSCAEPGEPCMPIAVCGDGLVARTEACDDGNLQDNDGCSGACRIEQGMTCGEQPSVCTPTTCGDGVQEGTETCDDGNAQPGDGCSETCALEPLCNASMQDCEALCGDGLIVFEECDDHNTIDGDGCSSACHVEAGFECAASEGDASQCNPACGDGVLSAGEQCDDGINDGGYGECGPDCTLSEYCGDGIINGNEECDLGPVASDGCEGCRALFAR